MARETKVGLLIGVGVILLVAIIVNDHLVTVDQAAGSGELSTLLGGANQAEAGASRAGALGQAEAGTPAFVRRTRGGAGGGYQDASQRRISPLGRTRRVRSPRSSVAANAVGTNQTNGRSRPLRSSRSDRANTRSMQPRRAPQHARRSTAKADPGPAVSHGAWSANAQPTQQTVPEPEVLEIGGPSSDQGDSADAGPALPRGLQAAARIDAGPRINLTPVKAQASTPKGQPSRGGDFSADRGTASGSSIIHYVKSGESLSELAVRYYQDPAYWKRIAAANPDQVGEKGQVVEGARLVIPNKGDIEDSGAGAEPSKSTRRKQVRGDRVDDVHQTRSSTVSRDARTITVKLGDSLSKLAKRHLGDPARWPALFEANRDKLDSKDDLHVGQTLRLPVAGDSDRNDSSSGASTQNASGKASSRRSAVKNVTVKSDDTLFDIAARTLGEGKRWREIYQANRDKLDSPSDLSPGDVLKMPTD